MFVFFGPLALNEVRLVAGVPHRVWFANPNRAARFLVAPNGEMRLFQLEEIAAFPLAANEVGAFARADAAPAVPFEPYLIEDPADPLFVPRLAA
jgi:hypothetical protein